MKYVYMYIYHGCREFQTLLFSILFVDLPKWKHFEIIQNMTLSTDNATTVSTTNAIPPKSKKTATECTTLQHNPCGSEFSRKSTHMYHTCDTRYMTDNSTWLTIKSQKIVRFQFVPRIVSHAIPPKSIEVRVTDPNTWGRETARKDKRERTRQRERYLRDPSNRMTNISRYKLKSDYFLWFNSNVYREIPRISVSRFGAFRGCEVSVESAILWCPAKRGKKIRFPGILRNKFKWKLVSNLNLYRRACDFLFVEYLGGVFSVETATPKWTSLKDHEEWHCTMGWLQLVGSIKL